MNIVLISLYELGHQPFNLASPTAHLLAAGFQVNCLDLSVEPFAEDLIKEAQLVALSTPMHTALRLSEKVAKRVRKLNPGCHICFFGLYAGMHSEFLLAQNGNTGLADSIAGGEFEQTLVQIARAVVNNLNDPRFENRSSLPQSITSVSRQKFIVPERSLMPPLDRYTRLKMGEELRLTGYTLASRGCAHRCRHCPITPVYAGRMRIIPKEIVLADVEQLVELGAEHITFGDPDFLNGVKHSLDIVREFHQRFPELTFDFTAKIEHLLEYQHLLPEFKATGCVFIVSAVELLNDAILKFLAKNHTKSDVQEALHLTHAAGIPLRPSLMPFTPWTKISDLLDIFNLVEEFHLYDQIDPIQYSIRLLIPPGSSILNLGDIKPFVLGLDKEKWLYAWRHPHSDMDELQIAIAEMVEKAAGRHQDLIDTYFEIRNGVFELAGRKRQIRPTHLAQQRMFTPRLTEDWFC
ncbi:MAG: CUAEP/CCAEP-tail radical SAM (seleno)protein [bacterium]